MILIKNYTYIHIVRLVFYKKIKKENVESMTKKLLKYLTFFSNWTEDDTNSFSKIVLKWLLFTQLIIHSYNTHFIKPYRSPPNFGKALWNMNHIFLLRPKTAKIYQETKIYKIKHSTCKNYLNQHSFIR